MYSYEVSFRWNSKAYREIVTTSDSIKARELVRGRYDGAQITSVRQVK